MLYVIIHSNIQLIQIIIRRSAHRILRNSRALADGKTSLISSSSSQWIGSWISLSASNWASAAWFLSQWASRTSTPSKILCLESWFVNWEAGTTKVGWSLVSLVVTDWLLLKSSWWSLVTDLFIILIYLVVLKCNNVTFEWRRGCNIFLSQRTVWISFVTTISWSISFVWKSSTTDGWFLQVINLTSSKRLINSAILTALTALAHT